jgi:carbon storage regulator
MLVLSRKTGERIHIGDNITIEIRRVAGNRVTLALEAPRTVRILRGELNQAAREFRDPAEFQNGAEFHNGAEFEISTTGEGANGHHEISEYAVASENDAEPGPEPYAVIHRRLHVLPTLSPQPISHPAVT